MKQQTYKDDIRRFKGLQKILAIIDLILNPKAVNWPFLYTNVSEEYSLPKNHIAIKEFNINNTHHIWCIRWL